MSNRGKAGHQAEASSILHRPGQGGQSVPGSEKIFEINFKETIPGRRQIDKFLPEEGLQH